MHMINQTNSSLTLSLENKYIELVIPSKHTPPWGRSPFVVASANYDLRSLNYIENFVDEVALQLVPDIEVNCECEIGYHPLAVQVSKFPCGGFTIGTALLHAVRDGFGVARFMHSLAELAGGKSKPSAVPVWERAAG
ncbi:hypothetical protein Bca52824_090239 [Brassica carinata]|uniref:Uncharacterized protein n=1 Tax=Brassica carinata TaxID=52824 RepID=A0A8X7THW5_BRACI|nr:hypothetical protein Bca52824_090239 [Brassica carinata]